MTTEQWLSLGLMETARAVFEGGSLRTIEAADSMIVGIPKTEDGHHVLGEASSREEAVVVATMLRMWNPN